PVDRRPHGRVRGPGDRYLYPLRLAAPGGGLSLRRARLPLAPPYSRPGDDGRRGNAVRRSGCPPPDGRRHTGPNIAGGAGTRPQSAMSGAGSASPITTTASLGKRADLEHPVHELIAERWSPRAFSPRLVAPSTLHSILEAARWAPSADN